MFVCGLRYKLGLIISSTKMTYSDPSISSCNATLPGPSLQTLCSAAEYIVFMTALDEAIRNNPKISRKCERIIPVEEPVEEYDFIIAGGGGGGAVVAGKLSEIENVTVLVLEAGNDESAAGQIPSISLSLIGSEIDWMYYTSNESYGCLSTNGSCYWPSARSLGGNTAHHGLVYLRGNPTDYNNWADEGNDGWDWEEVLEYYKNMENNVDINEVGYDYHGTGGPLTIEYFSYISELSERFLEASEQSGFGVTKDPNGINLTGLARMQATQDGGVRVSSATAYLQPRRGNKNLDISLNSFVTKIIIENDTAVGVEYVKNGEHKNVRARQEVIVAMGTIRSPQILLLSGIGPKEHLVSHGIDVVKELPGVGENLHNHPSYLLAFSINETDTYINNKLVAEEYLENQTGPMSIVDDTYLIGAGYTNRTTSEYPDFQLVVIGSSAACAPGDVGALSSDGRRQVAIAVANLHPKSRGRISLASNDPFEHPVIWWNCLSEESDVDVIVDGIEVALNIIKEEPLQKYDFQLVGNPLEVCTNYTNLRREYWACAIRQETANEWHPVGTCKMGPVSDPLAVVDTELRVHGIKNLRVTDASVMPQIISGNTAAPTMMIAERGADFIKNTLLSTCE